MTENRYPEQDPRESRDGTSWPTIVVPVLLLVLFALAVWRFWYVPGRAAELYSEGQAAYAEGDMERAAELLERHFELDPDHVEGNVLLGWSQWRLGRPEEAEEHFERAHEAEPDRLDAVRGLGAVRLALGKNREAVTLLENAAWNNPLDLDIQRALAEAYRRDGQNIAAARIYRELLWRDPSDFNSEEILLEMFGYPQLGRDLAFALPERPRPEELQLSARTSGDAFEIRTEGGWREAYLNGVILSPARPGEFSVTASLGYETYRTWFEEIGAMHAGFVRVYTILPPAFYRAFHDYNAEADEPLRLIQGVWLDDLAENLFDPETTADFEAGIRSAIDVIHGRAEVACRPGHYCGIYTADVSDYVAGMGLGRDMEPSLVRRTNEANPDRTSFEGQYVSVPEGTPTEVWFAERMDLAVRYEMELFNAQRPLSVVNWPALDPLEHDLGPTLEEELRLRRQAGETVSDTLPSISNHPDGVSIDVARFRTDSTFQAGLFALYHVFHHRPSTLFLDPAYAGARDADGPNPFLGYLRELKAAHDGIPLVIGAFGLSTSLEPVHLHPRGWDNGGHTEREQADLLVRFSRNVRDAGMAGGFVFEWIDEWWKQVDDDFVASLEDSRSSDPMWLNRLDPEETFGIRGFRPFRTVPLLRGLEDDWRHAALLYEGGEEGGGSGLVEAVYAMADDAHLYLRVDVPSGGAAPWADRSLWLALGTVPGRAGSLTLPGGVSGPASGTTFLVQLDGLSDGRLLVAENYAPWEERPVPGRPDVSRVRLKEDLDVSLDSAAFGELVIEVNPPRWTAEGEEVAPRNLSWSPLTRGTADPEDPGSTSDATWNAAPGSGMVEVRIPWTKLLVTDPSKKLVFAGTLEGVPVSSPTEGISVAALVVERADTATRIVASLPSLSSASAAPDDGEAEAPVVFTWEDWVEVRYRPYLKPAYFALRDLWATWPRWGN